MSNLSHRKEQLLERAAIRRAEFDARCARRKAERARGSTLDLIQAENARRASLIARYGTPAQRKAILRERRKAEYQEAKRAERAAHDALERIEQLRADGGVVTDDDLRAARSRWWQADRLRERKLRAWRSLIPFYRNQRKHHHDD